MNFEKKFGLKYKPYMPYVQESLKDMTYDQRLLKLSMQFNYNNIDKYILICHRLFIFNDVCPLGDWDDKSKFIFLQIICNSK